MNTHKKQKGKGGKEREEERKREREGRMETDGGAGRKWVESSHLTNSRKTKCSGAKHFMFSVHRPAKVLPQDLTGGSRPLCNVPVRLKTCLSPSSPPCPSPLLPPHKLSSLVPL